MPTDGLRAGRPPGNRDVQREIFNYREVRGELGSEELSLPKRKRYGSYLAAYLEWGPECVHRLNGMWAFALYDEPAGPPLLSRDRFGEKPLHYRLRDGKLIFGSEVKAILVHPVQRRANREVVSNYLYKGEAQGTLKSFFEDMMMLPPAHNAVFDLRAKRLSMSRYYSTALRKSAREARRVSHEPAQGRRATHGLRRPCEHLAQQRHG